MKPAESVIHKNLTQLEASTKPARTNTNTTAGSLCHWAEPTSVW